MNWTGREELFFSESHGRYFSFEIQNVRAGQKEGRDLMQDLEDIRNGIQIIHASDAEKRNKENKKERRQKLRESAVRRLEKKLLENHSYCFGINLDILEKGSFLSIIKPWQG